MVKSLNGVTTVKMLTTALRTEFLELRNVAVSTVWRYLSRTLRLSKTLASKRNPRILNTLAYKERWEGYQSNLVRSIRSEDLICSIDEVAFYIGVQARMKWAPKGQRHYVNDYSQGYKRFTLLLMISIEGQYAMQIIQGSCTTAIFGMFMIDAKKLFNPMRQLSVIADNCTVHCTTFVRAIAKYTPVKFMHPPPCEPHCKPVEMIFSKLKANIIYYDVRDGDALVKYISREMSKTDKSVYRRIFEKSYRYTISHQI